MGEGGLDWDEDKEPTMAELPDIITVKVLFRAIDRTEDAVRELKEAVSELREPIVALRRAIRWCAVTAGAVAIVAGVLLWLR